MELVEHGVHVAHDLLEHWTALASMAAIMYIVYIQAWLWHVPYSKNPKICLKRSVEVEGFNIARASGL